ncbi:type II CRISPR-associated endonuclease Cas1 [Bombilactobacillus bombi]|uniref:type II CRISPR-associated endonuclease Cas1 n=1 Tax=Bombilactobacillus bombi TaxID=1303590 RepID=UPI000E584C5A|nr:type II CRISPR-associated endonuclease Cas1 [Bombilactobacillus bombi]AXX64989.1 type II CRISPR-associated endonuclease Cas1 [Bombilactobacillus bombi]
MAWRQIVITNHSKLSYKANKLLIQTDHLQLYEFPLVDIATIVLQSTQVTITAFLVQKLVENNIKLIFCDKDYNPCAEVDGYYSYNNRNQTIENQINWSINAKQELWTHVVRQKMINQNQLLLQLQLLDDEQEIQQEIEQIVFNDETNREAVIARKYFTKLFGNSFSRGQDSQINTYLNYGYSILLSNFNREITAQGYLTELGIHHHSIKNTFNLSSDLMEPFRQIIDQKVYELRKEPNLKYAKLELVDLLNTEITFGGKQMILQNAITAYVRDCLHVLNGESSIQRLTTFDLTEQKK